MLETLKYFQMDHDIHLVTGYRSEQLQFTNILNDIIYVKSPNIPLLNLTTRFYRQSRALSSFAETYKPDVILINSDNPLLLKSALNKKSFYGYKIYYDIRTLPVASGKLINMLSSYLFGKSIRFATANFDGVSYITKEMEKYCKKKFNLPAHDSAIWTSGVNTEMFKPDYRKSIQEDTLNILYHGTIADNRNLDNLIRAIGRIPRNNITLTLLGNGNGKMQLERMVQKLGVQSRVNFVDPVPYTKVPGYINNADIGILPFQDWPGWNTSSPIKLFEYLACGKPVIVTRIPAHTHVLEGKEFAVWADGSTPDALAAAMLNAYYRKNYLHQISQKARKFVEEKYTWEKQAQYFEKFLVNHRDR